MDERKYVVLDGLRGFAALAVVERHLWPTIEPTLELPSSYLAVDLFFILSGFVLSYAYTDKFNKGMSTGLFFRKRLERLYPLYFLAAALSLVIFYVGPHTGADSLVNVSNAIYIPLPLGKLYYLFPLNFPAWSLVFEILVNLLFAIVWPILSDKVLSIIVAVGAGALVLSSFHYGSLDAGAHWFDALGGFGRAWFGFFAGVALERSKNKLPTLRAPWAGLSLIALVAITFRLRVPSHQAVADLVTVGVIYPMIVFLAARCTPGTRISKIMSTAGLASYAVYVLQNRFIHYGNTLVHKLHLQPSKLLTCIFLLIFFFICVGLDSFYDTPTRRFLASRRGASPPEKQAGPSR